MHRFGDGYRNRRGSRLGSLGLAVPQNHDCGTYGHHRDTRDQDGILRRCGRRDADDQARGRENAVVGPEHRCSQPSDAVDEMSLWALPKTAHPIHRLLIKSDP